MLFKKMEGKFITVSNAGRVLQLSMKAATDLLTTLEEQGHIEKSTIDEYWIVSIRGKLLAYQKFDREFRVETLQQHLKELLKRATIVNTSKKFPDYITCIKIISEYPIENSSTGLHIAYSLNRKNITKKAYRAAAERLRKENTSTLGNLIDYLFYPHEAIRFFLKSRSHTLKLRKYETNEIEQVKGYIIFKADLSKKNSK
ncbi:hypothetical protein [Niabella sp.]|uniref:hypothetical protein n=1 Tax=Niabella sp. TaxID=1962976 RepID=UPI0026112869|nr:hypothetical protein [Niabella sp.]